MFIEDLSPCRYLGSPYDPEGKQLKAVGWLATEHPYTRRLSPFPETRFYQLLRLLQDPWEPCHFMGDHECPFCFSNPPPFSLEKNKEPVERTVSRRVLAGGECIEFQGPESEDYDRRHRMERDDLVIYFGAANLFIPGEGFIYVAPSMIAHYVAAHHYEPPVEFWDAVMNCPEMRSDAYMQALLANGPSNEKWARDVRLG